MKKIIKKLISQKTIFKIKKTKEYISKEYRNKGKIKKILLFVFFFFKIKIIDNQRDFLEVSTIKLYKSKYFIYSLDKGIYQYSFKRSIGNLTIDYDKVLHTSYTDLEKQYQNTKNDFNDEQLLYLQSLKKYTNRFLSKIDNIDIKQNINNIFDKECQGFKEALDRILYFNTLSWQNKIRLNGLGRLDKILQEFYYEDIENNRLTKNDASKLIYDFLYILHKNYEYKSNMLLGDTGQIIILGGLDENENYLCNDLTYLFLENLEKLKSPDPKILLRVSEKMPIKLLATAIRCIQSGVGSPLFSNDDVIIPKLQQYGYGLDSYHYVTSACWEPFIAGKSFDQNNSLSLNFLEPLNKLLDNEDLNQIKNFEFLISLYDKYLNNYIRKIENSINDFVYKKNPFLSLFIDGCLEKGKDIAEGGAIYNNYGLTGLAMPNTVNSLLNIKKFVFEDKKYSLKELNEFRKNNFEDKMILSMLKNNCETFGCDDENIIDITNHIIDCTNDFINNCKLKNGGKIKFGLSSPNYISDSHEFKASLDGRKNGTPFAVHISSSNNSYIELFQFATKLHYEQNNINGNVVDFMLSSSFIENNFDKFTNFIFDSIKNGIYQMQMNIVSSDILIQAKKDKNLYPNLIVRVWGFSAYFNDLPEEYKNLLIERALKNENQ